MTGLDVWRIVVDLFTFGWVPLWLWIFLGVMAVSVLVGLFMGRFIHVGQGGRR